MRHSRNSEAAQCHPQIAKSHGKGTSLAETCSLTSSTTLSRHMFSCLLNSATCMDTFCKRDLNQCTHTSIKSQRCWSLLPPPSSKSPWVMSEDAKSDLKEEVLATKASAAEHVTGKVQGPHQKANNKTWVGDNVGIMFFLSKMVGTSSIFMMAPWSLDAGKMCSWWPSMEPFQMNGKVHLTVSRIWVLWWRKGKVQQPDLVVRNN